MCVCVKSNESKKKKKNLVHTDFYALLQFNVLSVKLLKAFLDTLYILHTHFTYVHIKLGAGKETWM